MQDGYEALNSPFSIGKVQIKNRFVMAPTTTGAYLAPDGSFSVAHAVPFAFFRRRLVTTPFTFTSAQPVRTSFVVT